MQTRNPRSAESTRKKPHKPFLRAIRIDNMVLLDYNDNDIEAVTYRASHLMKKNFQGQFKNLGNIIQANVSTLRNLLEQAENLSEIINSLGDSPVNAPVKMQLEESRRKISESIDSLIDQTKNLFDTYDKMIDEVLNK